MQELQCFVGRTNTTSFQTQTAQKQAQNSIQVGWMQETKRRQNKVLKSKKLKQIVLGSLVKLKE